MFYVLDCLRWGDLYPDLRSFPFEARQQILRQVISEDAQFKLVELQPLTSDSVKRAYSGPFLSNYLNCPEQLETDLQSVASPVSQQLGELRYLKQKDYSWLPELTDIQLLHKACVIDGRLLFKDGIIFCHKEAEYASGGL